MNECDAETERDADPTGLRDALNEGTSMVDSVVICVRDLMVDSVTVAVDALLALCVALEKNDCVVLPVAVEAVEAGVPERSCDDDCEPVEPWLDDCV